MKIIIIDKEANVTSWTVEGTEKNAITSVDNYLARQKELDRPKAAYIFLYMNKKLKTYKV